VTEISQVLLGLAGFEVIDAGEVGGELHVQIQTVPERVGCPECGVVAVGHGRLRVRQRDLPMGGRPTVLIWRKRRWRCPAQTCARRTWTETRSALPSRRVLTGRAAAEVATLIAASTGTSVAAVAARFGVAWGTAWGVFGQRASAAVDAAHRRLLAPRALGVDETTFLRHGQRRFGDRWCTSIVDVSGARLLDVVPGRSSASVTGWVAARGEGWAGAIEVTVCDPFRAYARGLHEAAPAATLVVDHYHVVKLGLDALDAVRANLTRETLGRRGRKGDHLYDLRRRLLCAPERLTGTSYSRLLARLGHGDPTGQVRQAWRLAHRLRRLGEASTSRGARRRLDSIITEAADSDRHELRKLARTLREWRAAICARYDHDRITNAVVEAINTLIKKLKRSGHGYRNFTHYRLRLLTTCGKIKLTQTPPTIRLRSRQPQLTA
jgi:transposase